MKTKRKYAGVQASIKKKPASDTCQAFDITPFIALLQVSSSFLTSTMQLGCNGLQTEDELLQSWSCSVSSNVTGAMLGTRSCLHDCFGILKGATVTASRQHL